MGDYLLELLDDVDHLSSSIYDIAAVAFYDGPHRADCIQWLIDHRNADGSWGEILSWQDRYLCTYSAAIALLVGHQTELAQASLAVLDSIPEHFPDNWTINFGGLVAAVDAYAFRHFNLIIEHHIKVQDAITYDTKKWRRIVGHDGFYNPLTSIAGHFAEWSYLLPALDVARLVSNFQAANGSISNSPGASAFCLLACQDAKIESPETAKLRAYVESLNPLVREIGMLDHSPHFVTTWLLLYIDHTTAAYVPETPSTVALREILSHPGALVSVTGESSFPGDMDTTASAVIGLNLTADERAEVMGAFDDMFIDDHYITFRYERTPAVTTNVHVVAAWPDNPRVPVILDWITKEITKASGLPHCKWHSSPFYTMTEIARLFADVPHPQAQALARQAGFTLLSSQASDGSWGWQGATVQETSCAVIALDKLRRRNLVQPDLAERAIQRAGVYLSTGVTDYRTLWIGKSLYYLKPLERWLRYLALWMANNEATVSTKSVSVLYVDDNPSWRRIFEATMAYHDCDFAMAEDAESALTYLQHNVPDVVVMDLVLPGMTGYQAFKKIRQMNLSCSVIATTAYYSVDTADEIREMGFDGYLEKPYSIPTMVDYLRKFAHNVG